MDVDRAFRHEVYDLLVADSDLQTAMGGTVRLFQTWAPRDAAFPYIVYMTRWNALDPHMLMRGTLTIDLWDESDTSVTVAEMRDRISRLLSQGRLVASGGEFTSARLRLSTHGWVPEETDGIHHLTMDFDVRMDRKAELTEIG